MQKYKPTIGLEIHVELKTKTKMFCGCLNNPDEKKPNVNICPICTGHPGVLPTINKEAIEKVLKLGMALSGEVANSLSGSKFDRKNYFYPDLPKAYQISQYDQPLVLGGELNKIRIKRIHLEEDTARLVHEAQNMKFETEENKKNASSFKLQASSFVDFNRSSIPLMEIVTEPDIKSGKEAVKFAKELQLILRHLDISDADMEKGHLRVEANISLREIMGQRGLDAEQRRTKQKVDIPLGVKVEVKNLNSFKAVGEAIDHEIKRQEEILEKGGKVIQETRGWDENKKQTISQRLKEEAHDYRYFPEPDLPPLDLSKFNLEKIKGEVAELPQQRRERFIQQYGLTVEQADILVSGLPFSDYFEKSVREFKSFYPSGNLILVYNYLISDLKGLMKENGANIGDLKISPQQFAELIVAISKNEITTRVAKDVLKEMFLTGISFISIIKEKELGGAVGKGELEKAVEEVTSVNKKAVDDYKKGQENALQFLIGQAMAKLKGRANPNELKELFKQKI